VFDGHTDPRPLGHQGGIRLARKALGSTVEDQIIDVLDTSPEAVGYFDVVLFLGILYHMRHPQLAFDKAASVCKELLVLETHVDLVTLWRPALALYRPRELGNDTTDFVGPNPAGVKQMLERAGFTRIKIQPPAGYVYNSAKWLATRVLRRGRGGVRMTFHAYR
jgi:tRNA (mo5U34)-methyltransferase